jgi:hypothetical protein
VSKISWYKTIPLVIVSCAISFVMSLWVERNFIPMEKIFYEGGRYAFGRISSLFVFLIIPFMISNLLNLMVTGENKIARGFVIGVAVTAIQGIVLYLLYVGLSHG